MLEENVFQNIAESVCNKLSITHSAASHMSDDTIRISQEHFIIARVQKNRFGGFIGFFAVFFNFNVQC